jgi:chemotaxis methyl-accepting protein methylase
MRPMRAAPSPSIFSQPFRPSAPAISPADQPLLEFLFARAQINGAAYRQNALARRVPACLRALQVRSPAEAIRRLERDPDAVEVALNALLIGVTTFFRDKAVFDHLQSRALPELLRQAAAPRMLSVGCSDGAEVYSLAILLTELGVESYDLRGIDCRRRAIFRARSGVYPLASLANLTPAQREAYFELEAATCQVKGTLRDRVGFQVADASIHILQPPYDLISCRNFAIYLEHPAAAHLWRRLHGALKPGGLLLTGQAEHPTAGFLRAGPCLFRKAAP